MIIIFLDIDGVLHPVKEKDNYFCNKSIFEDCIRECEKSRIIISSTWRLAYTLKEIKDNFSNDIASKVVGITPEIYEQTENQRYNEIMLFNGKLKKQFPWVAIDDDQELFPADCNLVHTDSEKGFDESSAIKLKEYYHKLYSA